MLINPRRKGEFMGYELPSYQVLQSRTDTLLTSFYYVSNRYQEPDYETLYNRVLKLDTDYLEKAKKEHTMPSWLPLYSPNIKKRLDQISCITQLAKKLEHPTSRDEEKKRRSHTILLGALFYWLQSLKKSHEKKYPFFNTYINGSVFQRLIAETLNIQEKNNLDQDTLANCCEAYSKYLMQKGASEQFAYIKETPNFLVELNHIVKKSSERAGPIRSQLEFIDFIQSMGNMLGKTDKKMNEAINNLSKTIDKKLGRNANASIKCSELVKLLEKLSPSPDRLTKGMIKELLPPPSAKITMNGISLAFNTEGIISQEPSGEEVDLCENGDGMSFLDYMQERLEINSHYALFGAYILALDECNPSSNLAKTIKIALGVTPINPIDMQTKGNALLALKNYIDLPLPEKETIQCDSWDKDNGLDYMKQALEIKLGHLTEEPTFGV